ncbi:DUF4184 family protein [Candidatus Micrarchaeota archaeon]|nr:DUF4184 family protein [Candidatus Micrarchaeota archaeon]
MIEHMPLTPFHWSILIFGFLAFSYFYIPALAISSVVMDLEPFYYMFISPSGNLHGFFHTYMGATIIALVVGFILIKFRKRIDVVAENLKIRQKNISEKWVYFSSFFGAYSHIFIDSFMHSDLKPFWPVTNYNPLLGLVGTFEIYLITGIGLCALAVLYLLQILKK